LDNVPLRSLLANVPLLLSASHAPALGQMAVIPGSKLACLRRQRCGVSIAEAIDRFGHYALRFLRLAHSS
jgi:hypothetical protein